MSPFPTPTTQPGPSLNVQSWISTSDLSAVMGEAFVLPLEDREQRDGRPDVGDDEDHLEERPEEDAVVSAGADDVPVVGHRGSVGRFSNACPKKVVSDAGLMPRK